MVTDKRKNIIKTSFAMISSGVGYVFGPVPIVFGLLGGLIGYTIGKKTSDLIK